MSHLSYPVNNSLFCCVAHHCIYRSSFTSSFILGRHWSWCTFSDIMVEEQVLVIILSSTESFRGGERSWVLESNLFIKVQVTEKTYANKYVMKICIQNISSSCHIPYLHTLHFLMQTIYGHVFSPLSTGCTKLLCSWAAAWTCLLTIPRSQLYSASLQFLIQNIFA